MTVKLKGEDCGGNERGSRWILVVGSMVVGGGGGGDDMVLTRRTSRGVEDVVRTGVKNNRSFPR